MSAQPRTRRSLGQLITLGDRATVHLCDDAIEIDLIDGYDIETKRVFFSDVQLITFHRKYSRFGLWISGLSALIGLLIWLSVASANSSNEGWIAFWVAFAPNLPVVLWFLRPYAYVTVFGKRTKAGMCWHFRHARGRKVFDELVVLVKQAQERDRQRVAERTVAAAPILPTAESAPMDATAQAPTNP